MTTTYYQYHPIFSDWTGIGTVNTGYATSEHVPVIVGTGLTQTWTGSGWSTTTDYRGTYYYVTSDYEPIGESLSWLNPNSPPSAGIATTEAPPTVPASGYRLGWSGTDWELNEVIFRGQILSDLSTGISSFHNVTITGILTASSYVGSGASLTDLPITSGGAGGICMKFKSSTNTSMSDPGKGKWRVNNSTQSSATQLAVDIQTEGKYNINALLSAVTVGTKVFIQRKDRPDEYNVYRVNVVPTLQGNTSDGWYLFSDVTNLKSGGSNIHDNKDCVLCLKAPNQVEAEDITPSSVALGDGGPSWTNGTGSPEGSVTAPVGSLYSRTDGGSGTSLYVKESGTGNTGWVAK